MMQWSRNLRQSMNSGKAASICPLFHILWYPSAESHEYRKKTKPVIESRAELAECVFAMTGVWIEPGFSRGVKTDSVCFGEILSRNRPSRKKCPIMISTEPWWEGTTGLTKPRERKQMGIRVATSSCGYTFADEVGWRLWWLLHVSGVISNEWPDGRGCMDGGCKWSRTTLLEGIIENTGNERRQRGWVGRNRRN